MNTKEDVLKACTIEGNIVRLPNIKLDRKLYLEASTALGGIAAGGIGGTWNRKLQGFVFEKGYEEELVSLMAKISGGAKINLKKEFQFFETPSLLADWLVELAEPEMTDWILEPSAGRVAIVRAIWKRLMGKIVFGCEIEPMNVKALQAMGPFYCNMVEDFLTLNPEDIKTAFGELFDRIIANPPFNKNQDIDHIQKMYELCKPGGRIVSVASNHWREATNKKESEFRAWLFTVVKAKVYDIEEGIFKDSGTMVGTCVIVINKLLK